jgi:hypothetical protein
VTFISVNRIREDEKCRHCFSGSARPGDDAT